MEPTTDYGHHLRSSLRSRSPPRISENSQTMKRQNESPLRNSMSPHRGDTISSRHPVDTEEQRYEERRGEELRRQIREREAELAKITSSKDRLKLRIQNSLTFAQQQQQQKDSAAKPSTANLNASPLRQSVTKPIAPLPSSLMKSSRPGASPETQKKETPRAFLLKHESLSSQNEIAPYNQSSLQRPRQPSVPTTSSAPAQNEYMNQLSNDNQQLQRRLNLVVAELDRVTREKILQQNQLSAVEGETDQYKRAIDGEEHDDPAQRETRNQINAQRDANQRQQLKLKEMEDLRQRTVSQLNILQGERDRQVSNSESISKGLSNKLQVMKDLEDQKLRDQDRQHDLGTQIRAQQYDIKEVQQQIPELQNVLHKLQAERDDLHHKLNNLSDTYDHAVHDISRERAQIEAHNRRHARLMATKAIVRALNGMVRDRKQASLNEFFNYCKFDQHCHQTLRRFTQILQKCGHYQMKIGLKRWFQNALKPLSTRKQGTIMAQRFYKQKLKQRMFHYWQKRFEQSQSAHDGKLLAVRKIWSLKVHDVKGDINRAIQIWRDETKHRLQQCKATKFLVARHESNRKRHALELWKNFSVTMEYAIRDHVMSTDYAHNTLLRIAFNQLRARIAMKRRIRLMRLSHLFKAWKDSQSYRRYAMGQNVSLAHLGKSCNQRLVAACFQALRQNKENEKYNLMLESLNGNYEPAMRSLEESIRMRSQLALKQRKQRCLEGLDKHAKCKVASYFHHWRMVQSGAQMKINKNLKEIIGRLYENSLRKAFNLWANGQQFQLRVNQNGKIQNLTIEGKQLTTDVSKLTKDVEFESQRQKRNQRASLTKACDIMYARLLRYGLHKWNARCKQLTAMEHDGAGTVITKLRKWLLKYAFRKYCDKVNMLKQEDRAEARADHYLATRNARRLRTVFNALCQFTTQFGTSTRNYRTLCNNLDIWLKRRTFKRWIAQGNTKAIQLAKHSQNVHTLKFKELNENLGKVVDNHTEHINDNSEKQRELRAQANRIMANTFARFYYVKAERGIKKWKEVVEFQKHREMLLKDRINHLRYWEFYWMKQGFQNWIAQCKIRENKSAIKHTVLQTDEAIQLNQHRREQHEVMTIKKEYDILENRQEWEKLQKMFSKAINTIIRKNDDNYYQNNLRFIFTQWAAHTKRQVRFIKAITSTISKSMWQNGFTNIERFANDKNRTRVQNRGAMGMKRMFFKKTCQEAFHRWRLSGFKIVKITTKVTNQTREKIIDDHEGFVTRVKDWTAIKGLNHLRQMKLIDLWHAWKNVLQWQITKREQTKAMTDRWNAYLQKRALHKLNQRHKLTVKTRDRLQKFKDFKKRLWLKMVFDALQRRNYENSHLSVRMSDIAAKFNNRMKEHAMHTIRGFAESKRDTHERQKKHAANSLAQSLHQLYLTRMTSNLNHFRSKLGQQKKKDLRFGACLGHWYSRELRHYFQKWKNGAIKSNTKEEVNEQGPVVEDVLQEQMKLENYKNFLKDQGYTPSEVQRIERWAEGRSKEQLQKAVARMRHYTKEGDLYLKPKMFDRWRMFVKLRKLIGYLLSNMENKLQPKKVDLSVAFNRWKYSKRHLLAGIDRKQLMAKCANDSRHKEQLQNLEDSATQFMGQMEIQRDELVDNYMKSQRLAIALARDNIERTEHKAVAQLSDNSHQKKKYNFELILSRNINLIQSLKDRIKDFEGDNESLAGENEELRQFSLDGYQIAKNVQSLSHERESLSVDLADKSQTIQKLLDQNQELSLKLKQAQEHAIMLINQSNANMRHMQNHHSHAL